VASRFSDLHFIAAYLAENVSIAAYQNGELAKPAISFAHRDFGVPVIGCVELEGAPENRKVCGFLTFGWKPNPRSCWKHAGATADCDLKWMMPSAFCLWKKVDRLWQMRRPLRLESCTPPA
jgi:hypothetical protein